METFYRNKETVINVIVEEFKFLSAKLMRKHIIRGVFETEEVRSEPSVGECFA